VPKRKKTWPIQSCFSDDDEIPGGATRMKLVGPLAARSPGFGLLLPLRLSATAPRMRSSGRIIDLVAFVDIDGAPDIAVEAGVE